MPEENKLTYDTEEETEHGVKSRKDRGAIKKLEISFKKTILHKKKMKKLYQTICSTTVLPYQQQTEVLLTLLPSTLVLTKKKLSGNFLLLVMTNR